MMPVYAWAFELWNAFRISIGKEAVQITAAIVIAIVLYIGRLIWKWIRSLVDYHRRLQRALDAVSRMGPKSQRREGPGLWLTKPISGAESESYETNIRASRILVVANAKGGVGKTTISANIAARLAEVLPKPVLMIDLDFQGTLSSMSIAQHGQWVPQAGQDSRANHLISGDLTPTEIANTGLHAAGQPNLKVIPAFYDLAQAENRVMIDWLLGDRRYDIRFRLADLLHNPAVRNTFSLIIIDSPPRLTTGAIQALAAGTHLLIPTVLDAPSTEAVVSFVRQVETFRAEGLCPHIKHIGVVGSIGLTTENSGVTQQQLSDRLRVPREKNGAGDVTQLLSEELFLTRSRFFRHAVGEGGIAYIVMGDSQEARPVKAHIIALADHVKEEMRL